MYCLWFIPTPKWTSSKVTVLAAIMIFAVANIKDASAVDPSCKQPTQHICDMFAHMEKIDALNAELTQRGLRDKISFFDHKEESRAIRERAFDLNFATSVVVAIFVFGLVALGGVLSWRQFEADLRGGKSQGGEIKLGKGGLEVSSSVMGLIILVLSLGFFYLYVTEVYHVREISEAKLPMTGSTGDEVGSQDVNLESSGGDGAPDEKGDK